MRTKSAIDDDELSAAWHLAAMLKRKARQRTPRSASATAPASFDRSPCKKERVRTALRREEHVTAELVDRLLEGEPGQQGVSLTRRH